MAGDDHGPTPDALAAAAALASLGLSPARLRRLLDGRHPCQAWRSLAGGTHPEDPSGAARARVNALDPAVVARRCAALGVVVTVLGEPGYPGALASDGEAPAVLFVQGDIAAADRTPAVAVVGTRSATALGRDLAGSIGRRLAAAGVAVVSGLARGIDSAALAGALAGEGAPPVAVLGSSHDAPAPYEQRALRHRIAEVGAVLSELPPGAPGARWRFAVRNRLMAAMAQLVLVVECHDRGGALHTVRAARNRGVPVAAVPGSLRSPASAGTNQLLVEGATCVRSGDDTLALLSRLTGWAPGSLDLLGRPGAASRPPHHRSDATGPVGLDRAVLAAIDQDLVGLDTVVLRCGVSLGAAAATLERLADRGLAVAEGSFWRRR